MTGAQNEAPGINLQEARVLRVQPGDVVGLVVEELPDARWHDQVMSNMKDLFPDNKCVVLHRAEFQVLRQDGPSTEEAPHGAHPPPTQ